MPVIFLILFCFVGGGFSLLLFGGWLIFTIFRVIAFGVESLIHGRPDRGVVSQQSSEGWICQRGMCRAPNPSHARFCRRCGRAVVVQPVKAQVATWSF
jgi:ribosomal protein L40E